MCFRAVPFAADRKPLPELDLHPLFQAYHSICSGKRAWYSTLCFFRPTMRE
jgi:hypothetical protein